MSCSQLKFNNILEENIASIFRVKQAKQDDSMKALAGNFALHSKKEGNGRVDLNSQWLVHWAE
jgi:hypothetical protein